MVTESQAVIEEVFYFLTSDFDFQGPEHFNIAYEEHLTYSNGKFQIDFRYEGNWDFPDITIKNNKRKYVPLPERWFQPEGLHSKIMADYRKSRDLYWLSDVDLTSLERSTYPLTKTIIDNPDDRFHIRGHKIIAIYLVLAARSLQSHMDELPSLFENPMMQKIRNYLQKLRSIRA